MTPPQRRTLDFRTFDALTADVDALRQNGYERGGEWSLERILDHLDRTTTQSLASRGLPRAVRWLLKPGAWYVLRTRSMPSVPAPSPLRPPAEVGEEVFDRFAASAATAARHGGTTVDHVAFGRMRVADWQQLMLIHAARHLSFLRPKTAA